MLKKYVFQQLMLHDINPMVGMLMKLKVFNKHRNVLLRINISLIIFLFFKPQRTFAVFLFLLNFSVGHVHPFLRCFSLVSSIPSELLLCYYKMKTSYEYNIVGYKTYSYCSTYKNQQFCTRFSKTNLLGALRFEIGIKSVFR